MCNKYDYINDSYGLAVSTGSRVTYHGGAEGCEDNEMEPNGTVVGERMGHLRILMDGEDAPGIYHPTWSMVHTSE